MQKGMEDTAKPRTRQGSWQFPGARLADGVATTPPRAERRVHGDPARERALHYPRGNQLASALGWLSLGLGLAHFLAPRALARATGLPASPMLLRALGVREVVCGLGLLNQAPASSLWPRARLAGDAMDLAMLGAAASGAGSPRKRIAATAAAVAGVAALDLLASRQPAARARHVAPAATLEERRGGVALAKTITVNRSADECYRVWRDLEQLPRFMQDLESVTLTDTRTSHWKSKGPVGTSIEWDAEITEDVPGQRLAWRSLGKANTNHGGLVEFTPAPGRRGTVVSVLLRYDPPAGRAGAAAAKLMGADPALQVDQHLRRFKQLLEAGEISTTEGQSAGARSLKVRLFNKGERS